MNPLYSMIAGIICTSSALLFSGLLAPEIIDYFFPICTGIACMLSGLAFMLDMVGDA
jgi:lipopolysaccharide export LptBFGC system permease protein LptF